jgi:acyl-CoA reductase-like NAD-dependent aldehyde dehydrogenase
MLSALSAQPGWAEDEDLRRTALRACAGALVASAPELAQVLSDEQGKPLAEAAREVHASAAWLGYYAELDTTEAPLQDDANASVTVHRVALGVVVAITPWNYPLLLAAWKIGPAVLAGNTVVLKPSPLTPLTSLVAGQLLAAILPRGVLNVISGRDRLGPLMTEHSVPRKISFTGSTGTGKRVAASAAGTLKRLTLELGGNDAAIVLPDAEPTRIAEAIFASAFSNNGQTCVAIKRLYVHDDLHDELVGLLADIAATRVVGPGSNPASQLGPLNNLAQLERVAELVDEARAAGARVLSGGRRLEGLGYFYAPTILTHVPHDARVMQEEQFGPVLPVTRYRDVDEAVNLANSTDFGLAGSVWGTDLAIAEDVVSRLECGTAWINTHTALSPRFPFSGFKSSGLGVENGLLGYQAYTDVQTRHIVRTSQGA